MNESASPDTGEPLPQRPLWRVIRIGWRFKSLFILSALTSAGLGVMFGYLLVVIDRMVRSWSHVQSAIDSHGAASSEDIATAHSMMGNTVLHLLLLAPVAAIMAYATLYLGQKLANMCTRHLRQIFVEHLVRLDLNFHSMAAKGDLISRMVADLDGVRDLIRRLYGHVFTKPLEILALVGYVVVINWYMGVTLALTLIPLGAILWPIVRRMRRRSRRVRKALADNLITFEQITSGIRVIKAMGSSGREGIRFATANTDLYNKRMKVVRSKAQSEGITAGSTFLIFALLLAISSALFQHGLAEPASMIAVLAALGRITALLRQLQKGINDIFEQIPAAERMFAILDRQPRIDDHPDLALCPEPRNSITMQEVFFRYQDHGDWVLRGMNINIPVGSTIALVGASGGGKSTILDLIPRLHDCQEGRISWDDVNLRDYQPSSIIRHCAIVQQDPFLFDDTILENIRYGKPEATREEIELAARRAHVHDDIIALEGGLGYDTPVGDRGSRLSGGQRQRISIARALLRDAPVLLMDEPTSALDAHSETHVQKALLELMKGRTTVIAAHRLATIQHADHIYVIGGKDDQDLRGRVVEVGTHEQLLANNGHYANLVRQQALA